MRVFNAALRWVLQCLLHRGVFAAPHLLLHAHRVLHPEAEWKVSSYSS